MTISQQNTLEGTDGTTIDAATSLAGGDAINFFNTGGGVAQFDDSQSAHGATSAHLTTVNGSGVIEGFLPSVTATQYAWRGYFRIPSVAGIQVRPIQVIDQSGGQALLVIVQSSGVIVRANSSSAIWTSTDLASAWPMGVWVRMELLLNKTTGAAAFATYDGDSTTPLWSQSMSSGWGFSGGATSLQRTYFGQVGSAATSLWVGDVAQDDSASGFIGPVGATPEAEPNWFRLTSSGWSPLADPVLL